MFSNATIESPQTAFEVFSNDLREDQGQSCQIVGCGISHHLTWDHYICKRHTISDEGTRLMFSNAIPAYSSLIVVVGGMIYFACLL